MSAWPQKLIASTISLGVILSGTELYLRESDPLGTRYFDETFRYFSAMVSDTVVYYRHPPSTTFGFPRWSMTTNTDSLRNRDLPLRKNADTFRLLILGDSVAFGWGVPAEETLGPRLEALLRAKYGKSVEVVVDAVGSWNSVTQMRELYSRFDRLDPDAVLVLYCSNDSETKPEIPGVYHGASYDQRPRPLLHHLAWVKLLKGFSILAPKTQPPTPQQQQQEDEGHRAAITALGAIDRLCRANQIPFSVLSYHEPLIPLERFAAEVKRENLRWLDAQQDIAKKVGPATVNSRLDGHFNGQGLAMLAEWTANHLPAEFASGPKKVGRVTQSFLSGIDGAGEFVTWGQRTDKGFVVPKDPLFFLIRAVSSDPSSSQKTAEIRGFPADLKLPKTLPYNHWEPVLLDGDRSEPLRLELTTPGTLEVTPAMRISKPSAAVPPPVTPPSF